MRMYSAAVVMMMSVFVVTQAILPILQDCKYWCKDDNNVAYCCGLPGEVYPPFTSEHPGVCPPVRPGCTDADGTRIARPKFCPHDGACDFRSKCCYDTCLKRHVCKTADPKYLDHLH